jgi:hypothetical protein
LHISWKEVLHTLIPLQYRFGAVCGGKRVCRLQYGEFKGERGILLTPLLRVKHFKMKKYKKVSESD